MYNDVVITADNEWNVIECQAYAYLSHTEKSRKEEKAAQKLKEEHFRFLFLLILHVKCDAMM